MDSQLRPLTLEALENALGHKPTIYEIEEAMDTSIPCIMGAGIFVIVHGTPEPDRKFSVTRNIDGKEALAMMCTAVAKLADDEDVSLADVAKATKAAMEEHKKDGG